MATNKQICKAAGEFEEASVHLQNLKDRKQILQDQLAEVNLRINEQQIACSSFLASLKILVNE